MGTKRRFLGFFTVCVLCGLAAIGVVAYAEDKPASGLNALESDFYTATALLYGQTEDGSLRMLCTATAFERNKDVYHFVTAAHCVAEDDTSHDRVQVEPTSWYITFDQPERKNFFPAKVLGVGYQHRGDDFAVLEVKLDKPVPIIPVATKDPVMGEDVSNIASPLGLGKQLFRGHVSKDKLDRPVVEGDINWKGATLLQMSSGPGSSGSAIVSRTQKGIVAFLVGSIGSRGSPNIVAIPVSKFSKFWTEIKAKKYKWYKEESAEASGGKGVKVEKLWKRVRNGIVYQIADPDEDASTGRK